ncbi:hypothetical protein A2697_02995 [Candidatus Curtissbacteria bacterium RIFCSPHIGHO2_01_FULL_41_44]|uniref:Uncharacterized protein n=1 Tax=Candidatus Curtissbacteria bacterium RIFCSPLOWO2_01_FULL_42_50 TaxID=1797730 RepID=A0A1F5H481_9BACT|nr:MAG: hypothetical protein A2697_02995 [Candidatus Curtissbacteria bacterium RIFCSPHIGHO2_01_FULL_41_44]OGD98857.1 MAG: hypothetical protein A3B54_03935 [Candidatus Curtissbacteria bacterium RIFCSPLOWO2_01_FULL_42_50]
MRLNFVIIASGGHLCETATTVKFLIKPRTKRVLKRRSAPPSLAQTYRSAPRPLHIIKKSCL